MQMNKTCPSCGLLYEREPGFFMGAAYVAYSFGVGLFIASFVAWHVLGLSIADHVTVFLTVYVVMLLLAVPLMFRYSRVLFLYLFGGVKHDPQAIQAFQRGEGSL